MRRLVQLVILAAVAWAAWALLRELLDQPSPEAPSSESLPGPPDSARAGAGASDNGAATASKAELYRQAQELDIEGRSKMNKEQLAEAVTAARLRSRGAPSP